MKLKVFIYILLFGLLGCKEQPDSYPQREYVIQAFDSITYYSLHKNTYNFDSLKNQMLLTISDTTSQAEIHDKLDIALQAIDKHSSITRKEKWKLMIEGKNPEVLNNPFPFQGKLLNDKYAFVSLDGFSGGDSISADNYCDSLQKVLLNLYAQKPIGWIIDLRFNSGGWAPAMISGLGPILGKGVKAYFISSNNPPVEHYYVKSDTEYILLTDSIWTFKKQLPTAILIGNGTGSAGELLALAFRGNSKTKLIGEPTYGVSTNLTSVLMPDSLTLSITSGIMTDRNKKGDGGSIDPEIICTDMTEIFEKAYEWIEVNQ